MKKREAREGVALPAIWDASRAQLWAHVMGHFVSDDQKAERAHHPDRIAGKCCGRCAA
jgi:hypothetical protein